ncbi:hypothetical protein BN59_01440 [Legionella massiliensis]|uniref:Uncharacterized protein n=1 Tax=Legionella massiliensis TaxID=1034943 RepID=A0A078KZH8_9GAMM|nr:DUF523 domain-containing protein [Legionella massiliensis]CDZ77158.1 hypothetical protein BN59_01440 [Legionella massiliensis]CEE12896.1 hypothetical protein BN1094_01440 [Legionella massiliensis]
MTKKILMSACLVGEKVRYDGKDCLQSNLRLQNYIKNGWVIAICPEMAGGLPTPRPPSEIEPNANAEAVLNFQAKVLTINGEDVSQEYRSGAEKALKLAQKNHVCCAILKARSPSCGSKQVYDGTHSKKLVEGMGITAQLLTENGIKVFDETEIDKALDYIELNATVL